MSENNIGILNTPTNSGKSIEVTNERIILHGNLFNTDDKGLLQINGGYYWDGGGSSLELNGKNRPNYLNPNTNEIDIRAGKFILKADNGTNRFNLIGRPDGSLLWGGLPIITTNFHISEDGTFWYRKYSDGWIEQGGYMEGTSTYGTKTVTFHLSFQNIPKYIHAWFPLNSEWFNSTDLTSWQCTSDITCIPKECTKTNVTFQSCTTKYWYACGY